jgi:hypothetical protein
MAQTTDGQECQIGSHYYNEHGESLVLNAIATDTDGQTCFLVTPFFVCEGTVGTWEHEGKERLEYAIFASPATPKVGAEDQRVKDMISEAGFAVGVLKRASEALKRDKEVKEGEVSKLGYRVKELSDDVEAKSSELMALYEELESKRQAIGEAEDAMVELQKLRKVLPWMLA